MEQVIRGESESLECAVRSVFELLFVFDAARFQHRQEIALQGEGGMELAIRALSKTYRSRGETVHALAGKIKAQSGTGGAGIYLQRFFNKHPELKVKHPEKS